MLVSSYFVFQQSRVRGFTQQVVAEEQQLHLERKDCNSLSSVAGQVSIHCLNMKVCLRSSQKLLLGAEGLKSGSEQCPPDTGELDSLIPYSCVCDGSYINFFNGGKKSCQPHD